MSATGRHETRIEQLCRSIVILMDHVESAQQLGVEAGDERSPWGPTFARCAVPAILDPLPPEVRRINVEHLLELVAVADRLDPGPEVRRSWTVIVAFLAGMAQAGRRYTALDAAIPAEEGSPVETAIQPLAPSVVRTEELAGLIHPEGIDHLRSAAQTVADHFAPGVVDDFSDAEIQWLRALSDGIRVADLAVRSGYSERAMYRELRKLWDRLGVANRSQGMLRAGRLGLLRPDDGEPDFTGEATPR